MQFIPFAPYFIQLYYRIKKLLNIKRATNSISNLFYIETNFNLNIIKILLIKAITILDDL